VDFFPDSQAAGIQCLGATPAVIIYCNDVWGNDVDDIRCDGATIDGNLSADPQFCNTEAGDFSISHNSPCAAPKAGSCGLIGAFQPVCNTTAIQEVPWSRVKNLYR